jgi:UDP-N-acetylmuramoyl-tripeptide--D-alanyl-D-alanine ligase
MLTLADLVEGITGQRPTEGVVPQLELSEVVIDSREACPNSLFVALPGEHQDGHDFVADAFARGAVATIVEREVAPYVRGWTLEVPCQRPLSGRLYAS